jgi:hypothetical protein
MIGPDEFDRSNMIYWERKGEPDLYPYEMIQVTDDGRSRCRTWQWIKNGKIHMRTLIDEANSLGSPRKATADVQAAESWPGTVPSKTDSDTDCDSDELRAHGPIRRLPRSYRYVLTTKDCSSRS